MFNPQDFEINEKKTILAFLQAHAFGELISTVDGRLFSSHLPFSVAHEKQSLICHMAKRNPQWQGIEDQEVLLTFQGAHGYVSPAWYETAGVPTWNYQALHIYGKPRLITDVDALQAIVEKATNQSESSYDAPWKPEFKASLLSHIVGIEIPISEYQCKFKLSQNRSENDRKNVIKSLQQSGEEQLAEAMRKAL